MVSSKVILDTTPGPGGKAYVDDWALTIPAGTPTGAYTEQFTYTLAAN
jgi:hypothetical protein